MKTLRKINKPIKFFGLTSIQFGLLMLFYALVIIICVFTHLHPLVTVTIISIMTFISGILSGLSDRIISKVYYSNQNIG